MEEMTKFLVPERRDCGHGAGVRCYKKELKSGASCVGLVVLDNYIFLYFIVPIVYLIYNLLIYLNMRIYISFVIQNQMYDGPITVRDFIKKVGERVLIQPNEILA